MSLHEIHMSLRWGVLIHWDSLKNESTNIKAGGGTVQYQSMKNRPSVNVRKHMSSFYKRITVILIFCWHAHTLISRNYNYKLHCIIQEICLWFDMKMGWGVWGGGELRLTVLDLAFRSLNHKNHQKVIQWWKSSSVIWRIVGLWSQLNWVYWLYKHKVFTERNGEVDHEGPLWKLVLVVGKKSHTFLLELDCCAYLFELHHDVFRKLHILEHPLQFAGERCSTFWGNNTKVTSHACSGSTFSPIYLTCVMFACQEATLWWIKLTVFQLRQHRFFSVHRGTFSNKQPLGQILLVKGLENIFSYNGKTLFHGGQHHVGEDVCVSDSEYYHRWI